MIVVPTRLRAGKSATLKSLKGEDGVIIATPVDQRDAYAEAYPDFAQMEVPHGIGLARQAILERAREDGWGRFWMIDDDIYGTYRRTMHNRMRPVPLQEVVEGVGNLLARAYRRDNIAIAGINWRHRAWNSPMVALDRHVGAMVCIDPAAPINYWDQHGEDLDIVIQAILAGWHTVRLSQWGYSTPSGGTVPGGAKPDYDAGKMEEGVQALAAKYPFVSAVLNPRSGLLQARVDWKTLDGMTA
jgi:hypothetical protein